MARDSNHDATMSGVLIALEEFRRAFKPACALMPSSMQSIVAILQADVNEGKSAHELAAAQEADKDSEVRGEAEGAVAEDVRPELQGVTNGQFFLFTYAFITGRGRDAPCKREVYDGFGENGLDVGKESACYTRIGRINGDGQSAPFVTWKKNGKKPPLFMSEEGKAHYTKMLSANDLNFINERDLDAFLPVLEAVDPGVTARSQALRGAARQLG